MFLRVVPVLMVGDVASALAFYGKLGFSVAFRDAPEPRYAGIVRDAVQLHLQWHAPEDFSERDRPMYRILVDDPDALAAEFRSADALPEGKEAHDTPWGTRELAFFDPWRNGLVFMRPLEAATA